MSIQPFNHVHNFCNHLVKGRAGKLSLVYFSVNKWRCLLVDPEKCFSGQNQVLKKHYSSTNL